MIIDFRTHVFTDNIAAEDAGALEKQAKISIFILLLIFFMDFYV